MAEKLERSVRPESPDADYFRRIGAESRLSLASLDGSVTLMLTDYASYEGSFAFSDRLNIYMGVSGSGRIVRHSEAQMLEAMLRPGRVGYGVPCTCGEGLWDKFRLLALGADLAKVPLDDEREATPDMFVAGASRLYDDPLLTAVLTAMWREGEAHGLASSFFEHGLLIVANRLLQSTPVVAVSVKPLAASALQRVIARIDEALGDDLSVAELAAAAGMSRHHFSRAFKAATGLPPYEYLTHRRIDRAKHLIGTHRLSITETALAVGFSNPSQFAAAFRRIEGLSPKIWRQTRR